MPTAPNESAATYSGDLSQVSIPKLLFYFFASTSSGQLTIFRDTTKKDIYLQGGKPVAVVSNLPHEQLGRYLIEKGTLSNELHSKLLVEVDNQDDRIGDALIHKGLISSHELFEQLRHHLIEKIYDLFRWRSGQYEFHQGHQYQGALPATSLDPWELLSAGIRRGYDLDELQTLLEPLRHRRIIIKKNPNVSLNQLGLLPLELKVFVSVGDVDSLGSLLDQLGGSNERDKTVLSMIYLGLELELLEVSQVGEGAITSQRERDLQQKLAQLKEQNHFERLGIDRMATSADAAKAFMKLARIYHPDQVPGTESAEVKQLTGDIFALLNEAQQTLASDSKRENYLKAIESGKPTDQVDINNILQAEILFSKAETMTKAFKFQAAVEFLDQAIKLNPEEGEFLVYRGYASFFTNPQGGLNHKDSCLQMINQGMKMRQDTLANGPYFAGLIYKATKDEDSAKSMFQKALSLDRTHVESARELRLLDMRKEKKGPRKK